MVTRRGCDVGAFGVGGEVLADGWGALRLTRAVETAVRLGPPALVGYFLVRGS
jgi:hypothetical protein